MPYVNTIERLGIEKGRLEGRQEGRQEGVEATLRKLIELKFGEVPTWAEARLSQASSQQLDVWISKILIADTLEALFAH